MKTNIINKVLLTLTLLILSIFSNGQYAVFFAIWIFTALLLFTIRKLPRWRGFLTAFLFIGTGYYIGFDVAPFIPLSISILIAAIFSFFASIPYLVDSFLSKKNKSFLTTLIFPTTAVLMEYTHTLFNQYGTWGHFAYTQESQLYLLQSISVFGMSYITFLITWFASASNWVYEKRNEWKSIKKGIIIYGLVFGLTLVFGSYRVQFQNPNSDTIRIASISALDSLRVSIDIQGLSGPETENDVKTETRINTSKLNEYLFDRSITEADAGAKIVFWAEGNAVVLKEDENKFYERASQVALDKQIYLGASVAVIDPTNSKFLENKFVMFDKKGKKVMDYWKGISVPGVEAPISNNTVTGIQKIETQYGTLSGAICFDLDFPGYMKNASGSDILLAPSNDWKEINPIHTDMAKFRAIEQGFNFIRQTSFGLSIGTDFTGRVISEMDHFTDSGKVLITHLPTKGAATIYSKIGDTFIAFCLFLLTSILIILKRKEAQGDQNSASPKMH